MAKIESSTRADLVYQRLRADILNGRLQPGSRLRVEALGERYGASSGVLREALPRLAGQGLAVLAPQQGFRVVSVSIEDLMHLTEARLAIETLVLTHSLREGTTEWEANLVASHHHLSRTPQYAEDGDVNEEWSAANVRFHSALLEGCSNLRLLSITESLRDAAEVYRYWSSKPGENHHRDVAAEHKAICDRALERDVPAAVEALRFHIETTTRLVLEARGEAAGAADSDEPEGS
jgi:DNA-binding GntR family transcriptional regulator